MRKIQSKLKCSSPDSCKYSCTYECLDTFAVAVAPFKNKFEN